MSARDRASGSGDRELRRVARSTAPNPQPLIPNTQGGFSLVEVLIALFVTAVLTGLGTSLVLGTLQGKERLDAVATGSRALELAHATLVADLSQLSVRIVRAPNGLPRERIFAGGEATLDGQLLAFTRAGWDNPGGAEPRGSIVYVEYVLDGDRLVRRTWARADPTSQTPVIERTLLAGVTAARVSFGDGQSWAPSFASMPGEEPESLFPPLVELDLDIEGVGAVRQVFATGYGR